MSSALEKMKELREKLAAKNQNPVPTPIPTPIKEIKPDTISVRLPANFPLPEPLAKEGELILADKSPPEGSTRSIYSIDITDLNAQQTEAFNLAQNGKSFCLIGPAGSGKTTTTKVTVEGLYHSGIIGKIAESTKNLSVGSPAILILSFTNQAVGNIKRLLPVDFKSNGLTIHKVLEFSPTWFEIALPDGTEKKTMRYEPMRTAFNKLPHIDVVIIEEAGSVSIDLHNDLESALGPDTTFIYLGDLNQIPPVFGDAILGYKLLELPTVELSKIYRQTNDSPIKKFAWRILDGSPISDKELQKFHKEGELEFIKFKTRPKMIHSAIKACGEHFAGLVEKGEFSPEEDVLLIPFNKSLGTIEMNKYISQKINELNKVPVYEIITGVFKVYYAVEDMIYYNKEKFKIIDIKTNPAYLGKLPQKHSLTLNRWGINTQKGIVEIENEKQELELERAFDLEAMENSNGDEETTHQTSHILTLQKYITKEDEGEEIPKEITVQTAGEFGKIYHAYAITVHKSQGSEWRRVFILFHHSHAVMLKREILYTAHTRAREFCRVYYDGEELGKTSASVYQKGILNQYIKGDKLADKLAWFAEKLKENPNRVKDSKRKSVIDLEKESETNRMKMGIQEKLKQLQEQGGLSSSKNVTGF